MTVPVLRVENLVKEFPIRNLFKPTEYFRAVDDVSFQVERGSVVGLVAITPAAGPNAGIAVSCFLRSSGGKRHAKQQVFLGIKVAAVPFHPLMPP